jgi:hypothetical protein
VKVLNEMKVDIEALVEHADFVFEKSLELEPQEFMATVLMFVSDNEATRRDVIDIQKHVQKSVQDRVRQEAKMHCPRRTASLIQSQRLKGTSELEDLPVVFADEMELRKQVRNAILRGEDYNVEDFYGNSRFARLAANDIFKNVTYIVIVLNAMWIAVDTDCNPASNPQARDISPPIVFKVADNIFCIYFSFEITVRLLAFANKRNAFFDGWFKFDFVLVSLMVWDTWVQPAVYAWYLQRAAGGDGNTSAVFRVFRLLRLTRVARLTRLFKRFPELTLMIRAIWSATKAMLTTLVLLVAIVFMFSILFVNLMKETPDSKARKGCFENVPQAMNCLVMMGAFADQKDQMEQIMAVSVVYYLIIFAFYGLGALTLMNMLIGVLFDVVQRNSKNVHDELKEDGVRETVNLFFETIDENSDGAIQKGEFQRIIKKPELVQKLEDQDIDVQAMVAHSDFIFSERFGVEPFKRKDLVETIMDFQMSNSVTVKDMVVLRKYITTEFAKLKNR